MKKLMIVCCLLASMVTLGKAQGRMRKSPAEQAKDMQASLKLTDDQTTKIAAILTTQAAKQDSVRTAANGDRQAMMQAMMPLRKASNEKIMAVLTPDQQTAYKKELEEQRARMQQMMQGGGGGTPPPPQK